LLLSIMCMVNADDGLKEFWCVALSLLAQDNHYLLFLAE
jgi:hypothetical protein